MKVCTQSLKNATEQHEYKPVEMLRLNLNAHFILLMSINPLTTAHCDKNEHLQMRPVLTTAFLFAVSKRPTASQIAPHKTYFKAKLTTNK